ncbi:putative disease resistance RPP13-like protein 1 [Durio zibethinus]|uniref:Disease resistance RPP13-like protein 1 n=1 Tax=Durio zibethinus TaxID=66656 RepID=A0A6P6AH65_DURZI|nr:putative disease resistance RPP13-like protein 1 [Durio zibethinus]
MVVLTRKIRGGGQRSKAMSVVEAALSVFFEGLFSNLASSEFLNFVTEKEVCEELKKLEKTLRNIHAVLNDAEEKEMNDGGVKSWLVQLQDLAYDADDMLFATEALRLKLTREHQDHRPRKLQKLVDACFPWLRGHNLSFNKEMMSEIQEITARFLDLEADISLLALTKNGGGRPKRTLEWRSTTCLVNETQVYRREKDKETILDLIFGSDERNKFSVIPIIGKGGIGKTTLAQLVYNDRRVVKHFDFQAWIVKRCKGLPLAAKTIGGLFRNKVDIGEWEKILKSEIWNLPAGRSNIITSLRLSYNHLPADLKRCFAYCAILPKNYEFTEEEIVLLRKAEGFLRVEATKQNEDSGHEYFQELVRRSFFEVSNKDESRYIMHDLINDLAQSVAKDICFRVEGDKALKVSSHARRSSNIGGRKDGIKNFQVFNGKKGLRTFLPLKMPGGWWNFSNQVLSELLPEFKYLRVLSLQWCYLTEFSNIIGDLVHLRYLNFSGTLIEILPDSICKLYNLETLLLRGCSRLEEFPSEMRVLINLRHLDITGARSIKMMPMGIGELTNLQTLTNFVVSQDNGSKIREMENLSNLKGGLVISELQNVVKAQDAWVAGLCYKSNLRI